MAQSIPRQGTAPPGPSSSISNPGDKTGNSSGLIYRGGQLKVVYEALNALDGYLVANSSADQSAAMQSFVNAVGGAAFGGGVGIVPPATQSYKMGSTQIVFPANTNCHIKGFGGAQSVNNSTQARSGTVLEWNADISAAPETQGGILVGDTQRLSDLSLVGPAASGNGFATHNGVRPAAMAGLQLTGSGWGENLGIQHFGAAVLIGGSGLTGDHWNLDQISAGSCGFGIFGASGTTTVGDVHMTRLRFNVNLAAVAQSSEVPLMQGGELSQCGFYAPYGFYRWDNGLGSNGVFLDSLDLHAISIESPGNGCVYDELYANTRRGGVAHCVFGHGILGNISAAGFRWTATWTPTAVSVSSNQITLTVPYGGYVFRPGGTLSDAGGLIPAGTTITAVTGTWPNGVSGSGATAQYTLTLSNTPTGTPNTAITHTAAIVGKVVAGAVNENTFYATVTSSTYPLIVAQQVIDNKSNDGTGLLTSAQGPGIMQYAPGINAGQSSGNDWGVSGAGATRLTTLPVPLGVSVAQYDVVEQIAWTANVNFPACQPAGATGNAAAGNVVGIAQKAVTGGGVATADILVSSPGATVNNKSASPIADKAFIKADYANPGGVTTATGLTDGPAIGVAVGAIAAGSTGNARLFRA